MPDTDPASPAIIRERRSRIQYGMTPLLDSLRLISTRSKPKTCFRGKTAHTFKWISSSISNRFIKTTMIAKQHRLRDGGPGYLAEIRRIKHQQKRAAVCFIQND